MGIASNRKKPPFEVSRNIARPLVAQVVDGLREAIVSGFYKLGEVVPSSRELVKMLGVSRIVTQAALERLVKEGFIASRPRIGSVVVDRSEKQWRGHVLFVVPDGCDNYFQTVLSGELRDALLNEGYLFTEVCVKADSRGRYDFSHLEAVLSRTVDLIVSMYARPEILNYLAKRKIPYAICGEVPRNPARAVGSTRIDYNLAVPDFAAACRAAGVKRVIEVSWYPTMCAVGKALKAMGVEVRRMKIPVDTSKGRLASVRRAGMEAFAGLAAKGRIDPDALYFISDDYLATGALTALSYAGLKTPEDIRIASWANAGLGPVYPRELSRMEFNPLDAVTVVASAAIAYLKTGVYPSSVVGPKWFQGETMRANPLHQCKSTTTLKKDEK